MNGTKKNLNILLFIFLTNKRNIIYKKKLKEKLSLNKKKNELLLKIRNYNNRIKKGDKSGTKSFHPLKSLLKIFFDNFVF